MTGRPIIAVGTLLALVFLMLAGCAMSPLPTLTPAQRLYAADGAYRSLLELAVAYKETCFARPAAQQGLCRPAVEQMRAIDRRYATLRALLDDLRPAPGDVARIEALPTALAAALADAPGAESLTEERTP